MDNKAPNGGAIPFFDGDTLATRFQLAGYKTALIGKYLNDYEIYLEPYIPPGYDKFVYTRTVGSSGPTSPGIGVTEPWRNQYKLYHYREHALDFLRQNAASPFLLVVTPDEPHYPAKPAPGDDDVFVDFLFRGRAYGETDLSDKPTVVQTQLLDYGPGGSVDGEDEYHRDQLRTLVAVDRVIGALLDEVEALGIANRTVFIFTSDNGVLWGEHRKFGKRWPYEESIRVPLYVSVPGIPARADGHLIAMNLDLPATLYDLAGISAPSDGQSLVPLLQNPSLSWRKEIPIQFADENYVWAGLRTKEQGGQEWKYVEWYGGERELYDLANDPYELRSLHADPAQQARLAQMAARLADHERGIAIPWRNETVPRAEQDVPYSFQIPVWGGVPPYHWRFVRGLFPPGLTLDPNTGTISGTPTQWRTTYKFWVEVSDSSQRRQKGGPQTFQKEIWLEVMAPDLDGDGFRGNWDNCPAVYNPDQLDSNSDFQGDACEDACDDMLDNDGDGFVDLGDPGCGVPHGLLENPVCDDGIDNDGDGFVDLGDPGCGVGYAVDESPECNDGIDNDGDGFIDVADPACPDASGAVENVACGYGGEVALLAGPLVLLLRRRRR